MDPAAIEISVLEPRPNNHIQNQAPYSPSDTMPAKILAKRVPKVDQCSSTIGDDYTIPSTGIHTNTLAAASSVYWLDGTLAGRVRTNGNIEPNEANIRDDTVLDI